MEGRKEGEVCGSAYTHDIYLLFYVFIVYFARYTLFYIHITREQRVSEDADSLAAHPK